MSEPLQKLDKFMDNHAKLAKVEQQISDGKKELAGLKSDIERQLEEAIKRNDYGAVNKLGKDMSELGGKMQGLYAEKNRLDQIVYGEGSSTKKHSDGDGSAKKEHSDGDGSAKKDLDRDGSTKKDSD